MTAETIELQCDRIRKKLAVAKRKDRRRSVFGAPTHRYRIGKPLSVRDVVQFEEENDIELPSAFRGFLLNVGNGNRTPHISKNSMVFGCGAGPYYGLFPLGTELSIGENVVLAEPATVEPDSSSGRWDAIVSQLNMPELSDAEYDAVVDQVFAGILPIGHQGCSGWQGLVLNGEYRGRIIYLDEELNGPPSLTRYCNFLDWYESWLDGVIAGPQQRNDFEGAIYLSRASDGRN